MAVYNHIILIGHKIILGKRMLYALQSESHGWIHGYLEDETVQYGEKIRLFDKEYEEIVALAKKLAKYSGERVFVSKIETHYCGIYEPVLNFNDIKLGYKFYQNDWVYTKISDTQAVCLVTDKGVLGLYSGNIYTFNPNDIVKPYDK